MEAGNLKSVYMIYIYYIGIIKGYIFKDARVGQHIFRGFSRWRRLLRRCYCFNVTGYRFSRWRRADSLYKRSTYILGSGPTYFLGVFKMAVCIGRQIL
jgi:hypothetical protein